VLAQTSSLRAIYRHRLNHTVADQCALKPQRPLASAPLCSNWLGGQTVQRR